MRMCGRLLCAGWVLVVLGAVFSAIPGRAQSHAGTVPVLMVSDIHFDPFHDPAKAKLLARDAVSEWAQVLAAPDSPDAGAAFTSLQDTCGAKGVDTPYTLLRSSLQAMREQPRPAFITVTGDLLAHKFECRYRTIVGGSPAEYQAFAVRTLKFVVEQLHGAFPGVPIYVSLGNNDSGCGDYQFDPDSEFLRAVAAVVAETLPANLRSPEESEFPHGGYYAVTMAAPMRNTRLIVLNDVFLSPHYRTCGGVHDAAPGRVEIAWLGRELEQARRTGQKVWVMGHIPPGVHVYGTMKKLLGGCAGGRVELFLEPSGLDHLLTEYGAEIRLALFAHTHMDEMRLIEPRQGEGRAVAVKLVPSITPVDGNNPAFTVARVNPRTAVLTDYSVIAASSQSGVGTRWSLEYDYALAYREPSFTPAALEQLIAEFRRDPDAKSQASRNYIRNYYVGGAALALAPFWSSYVCSMEHMTAPGYAACACHEKAAVSPAR